MKLFFIVTAAFSAMQAAPCSAGLAYPYEFSLRQADGDTTPMMKMYGGPELNYMTDLDGYPVLQDQKADYVYAMMNSTTGKMVASTMKVGMSDPKENGIPTQETMMEEMMANNTRRLSAFQPAASSGYHQPHRQLNVPPTLKNLVILVRFADHKLQDRKLPTAQHFNVLFNDIDSNSGFAPTGSVRDVFVANSYGTFVLESEIFGWVDLPETEAYYSGGVSGFRSATFREIFYTALDYVELLPAFSFADFDADGDGFVDMVTLVHSGYAAEVPGTDAYGSTQPNRVWSHRARLSSSRQWTSNSGLIANQYGTVPALWHLSGDIIGRVGVIVHEIGHCLGLPDMYGTPLGNGLGSYDFMSNHWGFNPYPLRQLFPPHLSAWSKKQLGWITPTEISQSGLYSVTASATKAEAYQINLNADKSEYLLIENRQPIGYDKYIPQGGLAIWHIDDMANNREGFPQQQGWPENGNHYIVALLQADGLYDLERGLDLGDGGDIFHKNGVASLLSSDVNPSLGTMYPNTDTYQGGTVSLTGIKIYDISASANTMTFKVNFQDDDELIETEEPTMQPSSPPTQSQSMEQLGTHFDGGNGGYGNMFDVSASTSIAVHAIEIHVSKVGPVLLEVWIKPGSYASFEQKRSAWSQVFAQEVIGKGINQQTFVDIDLIFLKCGEDYAFYITVVGEYGVRYTNGHGLGNAVASNADLTILEGIGMVGSFGHPFVGRVWNGIFHYSEMQPPDSKHSLATTFSGGTGQAGNMFDVHASHDILIFGFDVHLMGTSEYAIDIMTKDGGYLNDANVCDLWDLHASVTVNGAGLGQRTYVPAEESGGLLVQAGQDKAFYITVRGEAAMRYTPGGNFDDVVVKDDNLEIKKGVGNVYPCGGTFQDRVWNGAIYYRTV